MRLENKVAIVTGAADGLGRSMAMELAGEGATIGVADVDAEKAEQVAAEISGGGGEAKPVTVDVSRLDNTQTMANSILDAFGQIDILINNAGVRATSPFLEHSEESWRHTLDVDLTGPFLCMQACIPHMISNGGGKVLNIASIAGVMGLKNRVAYCAAKSGIIGLTKAAAFELSDQNICVNAIAPGVIETPLTASYFENEAFADLITKETPLGRWGQPIDIAKAAVFLASNESDFISGVVLPVDGGWLSGKGY